ncbi:histone deacetylation protein Rxt3-domain-containing protein [Mucor lusitanicus]|uniref:Histone deacetylation protein Rxt3-domain-containing protein n=1 Tax=Mucor circinelloides f. lusitanicus TaxID=29924 RepID=A0A8H4BMI9_MUCCL|nr:histone deacetylation protein Rxt3-domain-containing protein [Mucor lusitanicus]
MPLLSTTLVLDKAQEDTINDLVNNSNAAASLLQQSTGVTDGQQKLAESDNHPTTTTTTDMIVETKVPSADSTKAVTGTENEKVEDASITSEQLLFALTSIPTSEKEAEEHQKKTAKDVEQSFVVAANGEVGHDTSNVSPSPPPAALPTGLGITPKTTQPSLLETTPASGSLSDPASGAIPLSSSTPHAPETIAAATSAALPPPPPQTSLASTAGTTSTIPSSSPHKSNINTTSTPPPPNPTLSSGTSATAAAAAAVAASFSNFPEISAALRRLSTTNPAVIEQLSSSASSSSPRLPSNVGDRKGSSIDVSPHELFGNALAAVAANAAAARSSPHHNAASPKQQQNTLSTPSNTAPSANNNNNNNAQATATAIGNLAAFTANISNLLHSSGFHRNSFSQEDTQKLAAVVANARNPQQRRKSSMQVVGNAFSNMIDQAYLMGRNKSFSETAAAANRSVPPSSNYLPTTATTSTLPPPPTAPPKPKLIIKNEQVWKSVEGMEEKSLGFQLYSPQLLLPNLEGSVNGLMEIRVPARFLTFENVKVKKRALWGTDIYTDDSDIVAMAIHSGKYQPHFIEPTIEPTDPFALAVAGKQKESIEAARRLALSGKKYTQHDQHWIPDHDLKVTVRVLPTLQSYASSIRHRLRSREWGKHDGMSLFVNKVEKIKRGDARLKGRSTLKSNMFAYESYRKQALGLDQNKKTIPTTNNTSTSSSSSSSSSPIQKGRIKKTRRVMRMFQIRSEMKKQAQ